MVGNVAPLQMVLNCFATAFYVVYMRQVRSGASARTACDVRPGLCVALCGLLCGCLCLNTCPCAELRVYVRFCEGACVTEGPRMLRSSSLPMCSSVVLANNHYVCVCARSVVCVCVDGCVGAGAYVRTCVRVGA
jgi:hypothetical protein